MQGFSDRNPDNWDMAAGTVRGYRWWTVAAPLVPAGFRNHLELTDPFLTRRLPAHVTWSDGWIPDPYRCTVQGMHGGRWTRGLTHNNGGKYKAECRASPSAIMAVPPSREILAPGCGCGFWAYWRDLPVEWDACIPYVRRLDPRAYQQNDYLVTIPVAGVIEGSGKTVIGDKGFRSEYARITDMAFAVEGDCVYYDERQRTSLLSEDFVTAGPPVITRWNPRNGGNFCSFVNRELGVHPDAFMSAVWETAVKILGLDITWYRNPAELLDACPPDANYGMQA